MSLPFKDILFMLASPLVLNAGQGRPLWPIGEGSLLEFFWRIPEICEIHQQSVGEAFDSSALGQLLHAFYTFYILGTLSRAVTNFVRRKEPLGKGKKIVTQVETTQRNPAGEACLN